MSPLKSVEKVVDDRIWLKVVELNLTNYLKL
jgi:hypothetical protein